MHYFHSLLKSNKLKVTPQRLAILQEIESSGHVSVEEIYHSLKSHHPSISLATVYKNVTHMQESDIIREVKVPGQKHKYEMKHEPHIHLTCSHCGAIFDLPFDTSRFQQEVEHKSGFQIEEPFLVFSGRCTQCQS